jgi:hypothetical protein
MGCGSVEEGTEIDLATEIEAGTEIAPEEGTGTGTTGNCYFR